ncbi:SDR family NAD(P)-dependent oxidoreductase [Phytohalomonas tamaricis]|uniref:SDR family NAD(P)-dependent oxidoreductase n=1 Tax=Phytohalomonas tamaricis TaxID=2081032 RepID=UPI000D0B1409|nr:SDR family NAD(P)-dependent oxidoreductase [Phytohalomonas tamaricis]
MNSHAESQRVALITGAASGIGQALAITYAKSGIHVVGGYFPGDPHDPGETESALRQHDSASTMVALDVANSASVDAFASEAITRFGRIDIAVANAGLLRRASILEMSDERWHEMLNVDLTGVMRTFRAAARHMSEGGAMVAISSIAGGVYGWQDHAHYAAAKSGVPGLCRSLAVELAPRGIRCNAVIPGLIETPQSLDAQNSLGPEGLAQAAKKIPLGRVGHPTDVAALVRFLTSDEAGYLTGQSIVIDGGLTVRWPD